MCWLELLTHYNYEICYQPGDKNCAADALSCHAELQPPDSEDDQPQLLIPAEKFTELVACKVEMTNMDWEGLTEVILAALSSLDKRILAKTQRISADWQDRPKGLEWEDGLGQRNRKIWIPKSDKLWRKTLDLYHDSPITRHLGTSGTLELVACSYW